MEWLVTMGNESRYQPDIVHTNHGRRINDKWLLHNNDLKQIVNQFSSDSKFVNFLDTFSTNNMDPLLYQQAFLQVVTETVYHYPVPFVSEKTAKPLINKRPFVIVGAVGSLANLRKLGFKTFGDFWSEDYDTEQNPERRIQSIVEIVESVCSQSIAELQNLCIAMSDVLNYNFDFYTKEFKKAQLAQFEKMCVENLSPRYD